jgi:hypothetical protein
MRNTEFNISALSSFLSADASLQALKDMIEDFELEIESVSSSC